MSVPEDSESDAGPATLASGAVADFSGTAGAALHSFFPAAVPPMQLQALSPESMNADLESREPAPQHADFLDAEDAEDDEEVLEVEPEPAGEEELAQHRALAPARRGSLYNLLQIES